MSRPAISSIACICLLLSAGCESGVTAPEAAPQFDELAPVFAKASSQGADLIEPTFEGVPEGNSVVDATMKRNANGVHVRMYAEATVPNTATMWAIIFNSHENCVQQPDEEVACGLDDVMDRAEEVQLSVMRAGGRVIGSSPLVMTGNLREGSSRGVLRGPGLVDAETAEIHFLFRIHGPSIPGMTDDQIQGPGGGCAVNGCYDVGAAIFLGN